MPCLFSAPQHLPQFFTIPKPESVKFSVIYWHRSRLNDKIKADQYFDNSVIYHMTVKNKTKLTITLLITLYFGAIGMAISDVGKVCLFSRISGIITLNGKPVVHARLVRTVKKEKEIKDETTTDENGHFTLPAIFSRTITKFLPMEFVVRQVIYVHYEGKEYKLWSGVKREPEENTESRGKPLIVKCELNQETKYKQVNGSPVISLCAWDAESDPPIDANSKLFDTDTE